MTSCEVHFTYKSTVQFGYRKLCGEQHDAKVHVPALAAVLVSLVGCASAPDELSTFDAKHRASFTVEQNYQAAYRTLLECKRACEQQNVITAQVIVHGDLYPDIQSATLTTALHGALGIQTQNVVDLMAAGEEATEVSVATRQSGREYAATLKKWLAGSEECNS